MSCRILGPKYTEQYDNLISDMDLHYFDKNNTPGMQIAPTILPFINYSYLISGVTEVAVGKVYAAQISSDWHRVKVDRSPTYALLP